MCVPMRQVLEVSGTVVRWTYCNIVVLSSVNLHNCIKKLKESYFYLTLIAYEFFSEDQFENG